MRIANYSTGISRKKLAKGYHNPDVSAWQTNEIIRETPESYYQPTVELLDTILKKRK